MKKPQRRTIIRGFKALEQFVVAEPSSVDHPKHYNSHPSGIECIDIVEHLTFNVGNAVKYLWRAGLKIDNEAKNHQDIRSITVKDLKKALWYVNREIERLEKFGKSS